VAEVRFPRCNSPDTSSATTTAQPRHFCRDAATGPRVATSATSQSGAAAANRSPSAWLPPLPPPMEGPALWLRDHLQLQHHGRRQRRRVWLERVRTEGRRARSLHQRRGRRHVGASCAPPTLMFGDETLVSASLFAPPRPLPAFGCSALLAGSAGWMRV
jgi:hypothetical protein